jgi:hypothetical protein
VREALIYKGVLIENQSITSRKGLLFCNATTLLLKKLVKFIGLH